jgi:hypothetical protein
MITTIVVMILLAGSSMIFSSYISSLIIIPIESMIELIENITSDPLKAAHDEEERVLIQELKDKEDFGEE